MANELLSRILGDEAPASPQPQADATTTERERADRAEPAGAASQVSLLGPSLHFKGTLTAEEDLVIQGTVEGEIQHNADQLTIGHKATVAADIKGRRIMIQGKMRGDLHGSQAVSIEASAQVIGDIIAPSVGLKEGAKFKGNIDTEGSAGAAQAQKPPPSA